MKAWKGSQEQIDKLASLLPKVKRLPHSELPAVTKTFGTVLKDLSDPKFPIRQTSLATVLQELSRLFATDEVW